VKGRVALVGLAGLLLACGHRDSGKSQARRDGGGSSAIAEAAPVPELAPLAFGMATLDGFAYRARAGHESFKRARESEAKGDWAAVGAACEAALAADPDHLDASYLLAVARAKQNQLERILPPLTKAVSADFGKWGQASLDQPALQKFLETPSGQAWRTRIEKDRSAFAAALARSLIVTSHGDLYAFDPETTHWFRITRTGGAVVAAFAPSDVGRLVYVTREKERVAHGKGKTKIKLGMIDLDSGRAHLAADLAGSGPIRVAYNVKKLKRFVVRVGNAWSSVIDERKLRLEPEAKGAKIGYLAELADSSWIDITGRSANLTRIGVPNVSADWDNQALASALRIGSSHSRRSSPTRASQASRPPPHSLPMRRQAACRSSSAQPAALPSTG
jgi:hypothetical protein